MPGNRFAFAIRICRQIQGISTFQRLNDILDPLFRSFLDLPAHREIFVRADRAILGWQVADMTIARQDRVFRTKVFVDGLRLGRRLNDYDMHEAANHLNQWSKNFYPIMASETRWPG